MKEIVRGGYILSDPIVSVIMPAYNCSEYIEQAIESVFIQNVNLELIIINDCSKDNLDEKLKKYIKDKRLVYIENKRNLGVSESRNLGIKLARGKYIAYLDADDWWEQDKLAKQIDIMNTTDAVIVSTARELVNKEGHSLGKTIGVDTKIDYGMLLRNNQINCSSVLVRKEIMQEFMMCYDDGHEDFIAWLKILSKYHYAYGINEPLLKYRVMSNSKSGNKVKSAIMTYRSFRYLHINFIKSFYYLFCHVINGLKKYS